MANGPDTGYLHQLLESICTCGNRPDYPSAARKVEALVPRPLRPAPSPGNAPDNGSNRISRVPVHHRRPAGIHLFPVLGPACGSR